MAAMTMIQGWRARALAGAAVAVLAMLPSVPAGAGGDPQASHTEDVPVGLSDATATSPADGIPHEPLTDCFDDPIASGTTLYVPDTSPWTHWFYGTPGDDVIIGTSGPDMIDGGGGHDVICGYQGGDTLIGGEGDDYVDGGGGYDDVVGDEGDDHLWGSAGGDSLFGGEGSDDLFGELGDEYFDCGDTGTDSDIAIEGEGFSEWVIDCEVFIP
jgi:hypothetical protein